MENRNRPPAPTRVFLFLLSLRYATNHAHSANAAANETNNVSGRGARSRWRLWRTHRRFYRNCALPRQLVPDIRKMLEKIKKIQGLTKNSLTFQGQYFLPWLSRFSRVRGNPVLQLAIIFRQGFGTSTVWPDWAIFRDLGYSGSPTRGLKKKKAIRSELGHSGFWACGFSAIFENTKVGYVTLLK